MKIKLLTANKRLIAFLGNTYCKPISNNMKLKSLIITTALTVMLTLLSSSSGSIQDMAESAAVSITLVEYAAKFLTKKDRS
jgi:hypothetical protein